MRSGLYFGEVTHTRLRGKRHSLRYRVFSMLIDLDEMAQAGQRLRLLGVNRRGLFSFHEKDHGYGHAAGLRQWVDDRLAEAGITLEGGRVEVLCYPRMFGFVFNPLSVFFCRRADGTLAAILYEVANTHGERHTYVIPAAANDGAAVRQTAEKVFYVSPFLPVAGRYSFRIEPPAAGVSLTVNLEDQEGLILTAAFTGRRRELTDRTLLKALLSFPLMTLKVVAGIHWEALKLWRKGLRYRSHERAKERIASSVAGATIARDEAQGLDRAA